MDFLALSELIFAYRPALHGLENPFAAVADGCSAIDLETVIVGLSYNKPTTGVRAAGCEIP